MTPRRQQVLAQAAARRCQNVHLVLDQLQDIGNINACLRTAEGLGLLKVHLIEANQAARKRANNRAAAGANQWLKVSYYDRPDDCLQSLKQAGVRLIALSLSPSSQDLAEVDLKKPIAIIVGNENSGVSQSSLALADYRAKLPLLGLVQSYNVAVAAGMGLLVTYLANQSDWSDLTLAQQHQLTQDYLQPSQLKGQQP